MPADITQIEDGIATVVVYDRHDEKHVVQVKVDSGDIGKHGHDAYPFPDSPDRTEAHEFLIGQTEQRALLEVHRETPHDVLDPAWVPAQLERGIRALEALDLDEFDDLFSEYHRALEDPSRVREAHGIDDPNDPPTVVLVKCPFCVTADDTVARVLDEFQIYYARLDEDPRVSDPDQNCPESTIQLPVVMVPFELSGVYLDYPEEFRDFVILNLVCQVRDVYRHVGEPVPYRFDVEGFGKSPHEVNFRPEYD